MSAPVVLVLAKAPVAGRAKTRLGLEVGHELAARLASAALLDTLDACAAAFAPDRRCLALAGDLADVAEPGPLLDRLHGWHVVDQRGDGLGERLAHAHADAAAYGRGPVVQVGMDTPHATPAALTEVADRLVDGAQDAVLGPAEDGGWWVLGLRSPSYAAALAGVPMSTPTTCQDTEQALVRAGARVTRVAALRDVDTAEDAEAVARLAPETTFAREWRSAVREGRDR